MKYHFIGIKGSGMSSLAQIIHDLGNEVQGSDVTHHLFTEDALVERGIKLLPFDPENIKDDMIVVIGNVFRDDHPEVMKTKELGLKSYRYFELLGELVKKYNTVAVCGCHGKTTTTGLISHVFEDIVGTNYLIGDGTGHSDKDNDYFMIEACEYKRHFLHYFPKYIIMTNIDLDHVDYFKDLDDVKEAYIDFCNQADKLIVACGDDENVRNIKVDKPIMYYGLGEDNDVVAKNVKLSNTGSSFDVYIKGKNVGHFDVPLFGKHMLLNALSVITIAHLEGLDMNKVAESIKNFKGAKRRFKETKIGDIVNVDDYAHHPAEVKVTIESARQKYPDKEVVAVMLPNTYSRTKELYKDFADALNLADKAYVMDIFCDRERPEEWPGVTSDLIIDLLTNGERISMDTADKLLKHKNSVILFMSCKDIYTLQEEFEKLLKN